MKWIYIKKHIKEQKWATVLNYIDSELLVELNSDLKLISILKASFNRFPMKRVKTSNTSDSDNKNSLKETNDIFEPIGSLHDLKEAYEDVLDKLKSLDPNIKASTKD